MGKLLYFAGSDIDEVLMVVPDDYDQDFAEKTAADFISGASLENEIDLPDDRGLSHYRPYVG